MTRVLIVDDEAGSARLLKLNLEQTKRFEVRVENAAEEAVNVARQFHPDIVLLDVMMPRMFGGDVANQFQADRELKNVAIVFLSAAVGRERVAEHGGMINGYPFLAKPVEVAEVIAAIEKYAGKAPFQA